MTLSSAPPNRPKDGPKDSAKDSPGGDPGAWLRLDKWLFHARFCKSRALASKLCESGRLRVDGGIVAKPHHKLREGSVLTFPQGAHIRVVKVLALGTRRGPASEARQLYEDLKPPEEQPPIPRAKPLSPAAPRTAGSGRPTKRERRRLDQLRPER